MDITYPLLIQEAIAQLQAAEKAARDKSRADRVRMLRLSLSRLNHWLPRCEADPKVMQGAADFHHDIPDALLPQADAVFDDATALDAAVDMLDPQPAGVERLIGSLLRP